MTNEQVLKKAIEKAEKNGFNWRKRILPSWNWAESYYILIFSHDFAKAFWGEGETIIPTITELDKRSGFNEFEAIQIMGLKSIPIWQFNLQQMVKEKEPLKYIEQWLKK